MEDTRYKTFRRRFGAAFIDGLILRPLAMISPDVKLTSSMRVVVFATVVSVAGVAYSTIMHAKFGATVGKLAAGVIVLDEKVDRIPGWWQAVKRDALSYAMVAGAFVLEAMAVRMNSETERAGLLVLAFGFAFATLGILLAELLSALTNPRRRSVHDLIAGTVVVKTSFYSDAELRSMRARVAEPPTHGADRAANTPGTGW